jgi:hypothetical protein
MAYLLSGHRFRTVCPHLLALQWTLLLEGAGLLHHRPRLAKSAQLGSIVASALSVTSVNGGPRTCCIPLLRSPLLIESQ